MHHGEGTDKRYDIARTADTIAQYNPDIVAVQEVDRGTTRTEGDDQPALLAKRLGMKHVFGKCIPYRGGEYGILILSRFPIERSGMVLLPPPGQKEQRGLLAADLKLPSGKIIRLACVHLSTVSDGERAIQTGKINDLLLPDKSPTLLAGDFNARIGSNAMAGIEGAWTNSADSSFGKNTTPYRANAIDFIFFRKNDPFRVVETRTCQVPIVSDHNPVLSVLEIE
ncbi:MAG: endonuclease/exonuclease/phosphatase family protein [Opitutaceae bacterium]|nr:endonuclease/exonuclease/phosphatase family protein [Opitutaceae bacterium]